MPQERLRKQRELIETEKKRLANEQEELKRMKRKEIIETSVEKKELKTPSRTRELIKEYDLIDDDLREAKMLYLERKSKETTDLIELIPKEIFQSTERIVQLIDQILKWFLSNSTVDKDQLKQVIQNFV